MNANRLFLLVFIGWMPLLLWAQKAEDQPPPLQTIAFGSCDNQEKPQAMWQFVCQNDPQLWIWLGDIIYGDTENMKLMAEKYTRLKRNREYAKLLKKCGVIGIWDDHDYGLNDGGKDYPSRRESKEELFKFLEVHDQSPARKREGVYQSYLFGQGQQQVKVILLDTRYFRDTLIVLGKARDKYCKPNMNGDILGEDQWLWLEKELTNNTAALTLLCSSIQVIPEQHNFEKWANFPKAKARLFQLLVKTQSPRVVMMTGDRHIAEISRFDLEGLDYPIYEITSSGITHTWREAKEEANRYRLGDLIIKRNFGMIRIDWKNPEPRVFAEIRGLGNELFLQQELDWSMD